MNNENWIWVIRKSNKEPIRILDIDFDGALYELKDKSAAAEVDQAVAQKATDAVAAEANAGVIEKIAAAKKPKGSAK